LKTPQSKTRSGKSKPRTLNLPKHMTGDEFIELLEQKKRMRKQQRKKGS
jgi:hypothetical protein